MNAELEKLLLLQGRETLPGVLIAAAECAPLSKTGGLADVAGALPKALGALGFDARVITPYHRCVRERYAAQVEHLAELTVQLGWRRQYAGLERLRLGALTVYLIDSEFYFGDKIYRGGEAEAEQYAFFQRAVLETLPLLPDFSPEVLHCNDWHTAMLPFLIKTQYQGRPQGALKTLLTIHNIAFQGWLGFDTACDLLNIDPRWCGIDGIAHHDCANFLKTGCLFADRVNTVSPSYAAEICTPQFGEGLEDVLLSRGAAVSGILNGLDTESFDPETDPALVRHYGAETPGGKRDNKRALLAELGLTAVSEDTPLLAMVTRMTAQKGFDLVLSALDAIMERDVAFVLLGTGDRAYEDAMRGFEQKYRGRLCAYLAYSEPLSRRIYAGADLLLMPSAFEPCGLSQLIAMRYGTLPVVHEVGGLRDTVRPYNCVTGEGNGFSFYDFNAGTLLHTLDYALAALRDAPVRRALISTAMHGDYSFAPAALEYGRLYLSMLPSRGCALRHDPDSEADCAPFGALRCGDTLRLRLHTADFAGAASVEADGRLYPMTRDTDGTFSALLTAPAEPGLLRYFFRLAGDVCFGADGVGCGGAQPWTVTVYDPAFRTPDWAEGAVLYQIFPDRFAPGGDAFEKGVRAHRRRGRNIEVHARWDEPVKFSATTRPDYYPDDFYGGTLRGVAERLPELRALGVDCLYLNPIFEADSNHRYNTADYRKIDPMLGTQADFSALCAAAKALGIRVVLDGVFSHTGSDSVYFNRERRYPGPGAYQGPESPYFDWYDFRRFPDDYRCWWNFPTLPEVNETNAGWQEFVISGQDSVLRHWLRRGASGWRLDVADELPDETIAAMRGAVKAEKPDALLLGEVWEDATTKISYGAQRSYALGRGLDTVMNYPLRGAILDFLLGKSDAGAFADFLLGQKRRYPPPMYRCLMNLLGSHDTARLRTVLGSGTDGAGMGREAQAVFALTPEQGRRADAMQRLAAAILFALPGMPSIYYGDEEGMEGLRDPFCRAPYRAGDGTLRAFYAALAQQRHALEPLRRGDAAFAACGADTVCILRWRGEKAVLFAANRGGTPVTLRLAPADFRGLPKKSAAALPALPALMLAPRSSAMQPLG